MRNCRHFLVLRFQQPPTAPNKTHKKRETVVIFILGLSWGCLGAVLGLSGDLVGLSWLLLGLSCALLGLLGAVLGCLGLSWGCLGSLGAASGANTLEKLLLSAILGVLDRKNQHSLGSSQQPEQPTASNLWPRSAAGVA